MPSSVTYNIVTVRSTSQPSPDEMEGEHPVSASNETIKSCEKQEDNDSTYCFSGLCKGIRKFVNSN